MNMDEPWRERANCRDENPTMFIYITGHRDKKTQKLSQDAAKEICARCPVIRECRIAGKSQPGIWGGMTEYERDEYFAQEFVVPRDKYGRFAKKIA